MVLMTIRLNVPLQDFAYRFGISLSTVSRTFSTWLTVMDIRLSPIIRQPEQDELWHTMPLCFPFSFGKKPPLLLTVLRSSQSDLLIQQELKHFLIINSTLPPRCSSQLHPKDLFVLLPKHGEEGPLVAKGPCYSRLKVRHSGKHCTLPGTVSYPCLHQRKESTWST